MRIRYHFMANLFLTKYDKNNIIGWAKTHWEANFPENDWKSSKTLRRLKGNSRCCLISGWDELFSKWEKLMSRSARSQSWLCPFKPIGITFSNFVFYFKMSQTKSNLLTVLPMRTGNTTMVIHNWTDSSKVNCGWKCSLGHPQICK